MQRHRGCRALAAGGSTEPAAGQAACSRREPKRGAAAAGAAGGQEKKTTQHTHWPQVQLRSQKRRPALIRAGDVFFVVSTNTGGQASTGLEKLDSVPIRVAVWWHPGRCGGASSSRAMGATWDGSSSSETGGQGDGGTRRIKGSSRATERMERGLQLDEPKGTAGEGHQQVVDCNGTPAGCDWPAGR